MSLEEKNIRVNTLTVQFLMLAKDQTDALERLFDTIKSEYPDLSGSLDLAVKQMRLLERTSIKLAEENAELYDRYIAFLNRITPPTQ